jgi:hypothetical protein
VSEQSTARAFRVIILNLGIIWMWVVKFTLR